MNPVQKKPILSQKQKPSLSNAENIHCFRISRCGGHFIYRQKLNHISSYHLSAVLHSPFFFFFNIDQPPETSFPGGGKIRAYLCSTLQRLALAMPFHLHLLRASLLRQRHTRAQTGKERASERER